MPPNFDFLIIETYEQLAVVVAFAAGLIFLAVRLLKRGGKNAGTSQRTPSASVLSGGASSPTKTGPRGTPRIEFDTLATYIDTANSRAEQIAETQSAAALKLDTAEVAVNRLLSDIDGIMDVPRTTSATQPSSSATTAAPAARSNLAA